MQKPHVFSSLSSPSFKPTSTCGLSTYLKLVSDHTSKHFSNEEHLQAESKLSHQFLGCIPHWNRASRLFITNSSVGLTEPSVLHCSTSLQIDVAGFEKLFHVQIINILRFLVPNILYIEINIEFFIIIAIYYIKLFSFEVF